MGQFKDLTGQRFGNLTVLRYQSMGKDGALYLCKCTCGKEKVYAGARLPRISIYSCGCIKNPKNNTKAYLDRSRIIDKLGHKQGHLTAVKFEGVWNRTAYWLCECVCGKTRTVPTTYLKDIPQYANISCGCKNLKSPSFRSDSANILFKVYSAYKSDAKKRQLPFELDKYETIKLIQNPCTYCGDPASNTAVHRTTHEVFNYNGIDRVDNTKGYTCDNVVPCCATCNRMKMTKTIEGFFEHVSKIYKHRNLGEL